MSRERNPGDEPPPDGIEIPITGDLDLHAFAPAEIPSVVAEYVTACRTRNILRLRLAHGKGTGTQRAIVRQVLARLPDVISFADAPPETGGWGATVVALRRCAKSHE
jgi:DNA-nicking Smr family endonuclease